MLVQSFLPDSFSQSEHPVTLKWYFGVQVNAFMRREIKNTKLRPANALFFVLHFINCFHTFEDTTVKTIIFVWKTLYFFRSPKCFREHTYSWVPVNWETKKKNEKKRKETERKKNEKKTRRKVTKRNEKKRNAKKRKQNSEKRNETKEKEKKRKNVKKRNEMKSTEARR